MEKHPACSNCKHWDFPRKDKYSSDPKEINECFKAKVLWDCKQWNDTDIIEEIYTIKEEFKDQKLFVQDGSDYRAVMLTKADFFCAHFEPKVP